MELRGGLHEAPWKSPWSFVELHRAAVELRGVSMKISMDFHGGLHRGSLKLRGDLHGDSWSSMEYPIM